MPVHFIVPPLKQKTMQISTALSKTRVHDLSVGELFSLVGLFMDSYSKKKENLDKVSGVNNLSLIIGKSPATIYRYIKDGIIPKEAAIKIGNTYYFNLRMIRETLNFPV